MAYSEDHIALAAEYVLGTLDATERAQAEAMMAADAGFKALVEALDQKFAVLNQMVGSVEPRDEIWEKIRAAIAEKRALALSASARIGPLPGVVMTAPPQLSLFAFHLRGASLEDENAKTRALLDRVIAKNRTFLSGCDVGGRFLVRVCVLSFRNVREHLTERRI